MKKFDNGITYEIVPSQATLNRKGNYRIKCPYCSIEINFNEGYCPNCGVPVPEKEYLREANFSGMSLSINIENMLSNIESGAEPPPVVSIRTNQGNELQIKPIMTDEKFVRYYPTYEKRINTFCVLKRYTVIDFETANMYPDSVCQMGIVEVEKGEVIGSKSYLIRPPYNDFRNANIHGIRLEEVRNAKTFFEIWEEIKPYIENRLVGAYNARFDIGCLFATLKNFNIEIPDFAYFDILQNVKEKYEFGSYKLATVSRQLKIKYKAHDALEDALAAVAIQGRCNMRSTYSFMYAKGNNHFEVMAHLFTGKEILTSARRIIKEKTSVDIDDYDYVSELLNLAEQNGAEKEKCLKIQGEIFERCGMNEEALVSYEEAYKLNEKIGVKGKIQKLRKAM